MDFIESVILKGEKTMKVITIEEHINSEELLDEMIESRDDFTEEQKKGYKERTIVGGRLTDVD